MRKSEIKIAVLQTLNKVDGSTFTETELNKILNSGAIDTEVKPNTKEFTILVKSIAIRILEERIDQILSGPYYQEIKREVNALRPF